MYIRIRGGYNRGVVMLVLILNLVIVLEKMGIITIIVGISSCMEIIIIRGSVVVNGSTSGSSSAVVVCVIVSIVF